MVPGQFEGLIHTFADSYGWHYNNKLTPAISFVQLKHGFNVCICLADNGFHFNSEIVFAHKPF